MNFDITNDTYGYSKVGTEPLIIHCHHYNSVLQQTVLDADYLNLRPYLQEAAAETAMEEFADVCLKNNAETSQEKLELGSGYMKFLGFGHYDFSALTEEGGSVKATVSHYSNGWFSKNGLSDVPVDLFGAGFVQAIAMLAFGKKAQVNQTSCIAMGHDYNNYRVVFSDAFSYNKPTYNPVNQITAPADNFQSNVNAEEVKNAVLALGIQGNEDGLVDAFNVYLARMFANYYNRVTFRFEEKLSENSGFLDLAEQLLMESGHNCGFYTMGNIMLSPEFDALVASKAQGPKDWMHGIVSVINALGWGQWRIQELEDNKRMVLRVYNSYEAIGYVKLYGNRDTPCNFMVRGVSAALMNLVYIGNIMDRPELTTDYYNQLFNADDTFFTTETVTCANGNSPYCEFVIEREQ